MMIYTGSFAGPRRRARGGGFFPDHLERRAACGLVDTRTDDDDVIGGRSGADLSPKTTMTLLV